MLIVDTEISNGPFAAGEARKEIASVAAQIPEPVRQNVTLLVSELVTNAYRHSGQGTKDPIGLRVELTGSTVRIEVSDRGDARTPAIRETDDTGGWGLRIVQTVADRWGTSREPSGTVVWFELEAVR